MKININEIVVKMKILDEKKTKAIITLDFGVLVTKSFRILESPYENMNNEKLWLIPPPLSYPGCGRYHSIFFVPDKNLWLELEKKVWEEYRTKRDKHCKKKY